MNCIVCRLEQKKDLLETTLVGARELPVALANTRKMTRFMASRACAFAFVAAGEQCRAILNTNRLLVLLVTLDCKLMAAFQVYFFHNNVAFNGSAPILEIASDDSNVTAIECRGSFLGSTRTTIFTTSLLARVAAAWMNLIADFFAFYVLCSMKLRGMTSDSTC